MRQSYSCGMSMWRVCEGAFCTFLGLNIITFLLTTKIIATVFSEGYIYLFSSEEIMDMGKSTRMIPKDHFLSLAVEAIFAFKSVL